MSGRLGASRPLGPLPRVSADTEAKPTPPVHVAAATRPRRLPPFGVPVVLADVERGTWQPPLQVDPPAEVEPLPTFHVLAEEWCPQRGTARREH